jgi:hypothetical protein
MATVGSAKLRKISRSMHPFDKWEPRDAELLREIEQAKSRLQRHDKLYPHRTIDTGGLNVNVSDIDRCCPAIQTNELLSSSKK